MRQQLLGFVAVAVVLSTGPVASGQEDARAIIDKAVKAYGGADKLSKIKAMQIKGKGSIDLLGGITYSQNVSVQLPDKFRDMMQMDVMGQQVTVTTVYDGTKGWIKVNDMETMDMDENLLGIVKDAMYVLKLGQQVFVLKDKDFEISPLGEVKVNDRPAVGIKVSSKGHKDVNMYFDKETGLMSKFEHRTRDPMSSEEIAEERIVLEYQDVDGLKTAKRILVNRDGKKFTEAEIVEIKFLDKFEDADFGKP
jgi:hypothetical protein